MRNFRELRKANILRKNVKFRRKKQFNISKKTAKIWRIKHLFKKGREISNYDMVKLLLHSSQIRKVFCAINWFSRIFLHENIFRQTTNEVFAFFRESFRLLETVNIKHMLSLYFKVYRSYCICILNKQFYFISDF